MAAPVATATAAPEAGTPPPVGGEAGLRRHLVGPAPSGGLWGWLGPLLVAVLGGVLRFWHLDRPHKLVFDETYYVKQA
ncbi:MAG: phospholipid carrier-dependent glycosyltransferase, partial [Actinomycetes bacterium]